MESDASRPVATPQFSAWFDDLKPALKMRAQALIDALHELGPDAKAPLAKTLRNTNLRGLRELRDNQSMRLFYACDPDGTPILLNGGDKTGVGWGKNSGKWYDMMIEQAEKLFAVYEANVWPNKSNAVSDRMPPNRPMTGRYAPASLDISRGLA